HWRGRDRKTLLAALRRLRTGDAAPARRTKARHPEPAGGSAPAVADLAGPDLADTVDRFWVSPVPLPTRPPTVDTDSDLVLRQLPTPPAALGGADLVDRLRRLYATFGHRDE